MQHGHVGPMVVGNGPGLRTIVRNAGSSYARECVDVGLFLSLTPFILGRLGTEAFGMWAVIWAAIGFLALMDFGFSTSVVKFVADARGRHAPERLRTITATLFWIYSGLGLATLAVAVLVANALPGFLGTEPQQTAAFRTAFLFVSVRVALAMPLGMFSGILIGFQKQSWANAVHIAESVIYAASVVVVLTLHPRIEALALVSAVVGALGGLGAFALVVRRLPGVSIRPSDVRPSLIPELSGFSIYFFVIQVSMLVYMRVDALLIHGALTLTAVAYYSVASRLAEKAAAFCRQLTNTLTPVVAELNATGNRARLEATYLVGSTISTALAAPLLLGLAWLADDLLRVWMGPDFVAAATPLRLLAIAMFVSVVHAGPANVLSMTGSQRYLAGAFGSAQLLNLSATLVLLPLYGLAGAASATLLTTLAADVGLVQRRAARLFETRRRDFYRTVLGPSCLPTVVALGTLAWLGRVFTPVRLVEVALLEATACVVFATVFLLVTSPWPLRSWAGRLPVLAWARRPDATS